MQVVLTVNSCGNGTSEGLGAIIDAGLSKNFAALSLSFKSTEICFYMAVTRLGIGMSPSPSVAVASLSLCVRIFEFSLLPPESEVKISTTVWFKASS